MKSVYTCEAALLDMADAIESTLTETQQLLLADHLSRCVSCRSVLPELAIRHASESLRSQVEAAQMIDRLIAHVSRPVPVARGKGGRGVKVQTEDSTIQPLPTEDSSAALLPPVA